MIAALGLVELKLLVRNRTAAAVALAMPVAAGLYFALELGPGGRGWAGTITLQLLFILGFTVYVTVTTSLTARRQDLYLKRLRTGTASDVVVLTGVLLPVALLGLAQVAVLLGVSLGAGAPWPARPQLLVAAVVVGAVMSCAAGVGTSGLTGSAEMAQLTTMPFFLALLVGGTVAVDPQADPWVLLLPGGGVGALVGAAWGGPADRVPLAALSLLGWAVAGVVLAGRAFRWEPRAWSGVRRAASRRPPRRGPWPRRSTRCPAGRPSPSAPARRCRRAAPVSASGGEP